MLAAAEVAIAMSQMAAFNISNTLGDSMVLQRAPQSATVWGFGAPGVSITTTFQGKTFKSAIDSDGVWRQILPPTPASKAPTTITFTGSDGGSAALKDVLFGDVFLCSGQSNMQYTPHSMAGMNNATAEIAAADSYSDGIRFFTVGMQTVCGDPKKNQTDCSKPFRQLNMNIPTIGSPCRGGQSCRELWEPASAKALGNAAWNTFSAVCYLTGRDIYDALGGEVPIGLISSNWGGTPVQVWQPLKSVQDCQGPSKTVGGSLYNSMIAPFTVGPMALTGATWYQGESNVGAASYYACGFPSMITRWRELFNNTKLWFGFVQIANFRYSVPFGNPPRPEVDHSHHAGDLRQAQLAALALPNVGMTTTIDTGDWTNIHPPDKQNPSSRLANQALNMIYGKSIPDVDFPLYSGSRVQTQGSTITVTIAIRAGGKPVKITTDAPLAATQTTTLGKGVSVPRNQCITAGFANTFPQDCGYPEIYGHFANGSILSLNATATIGADESSLVFTADAPAADFTAEASAYGRASWPRTVFFVKDLPVIPWYSNFTNTDPWVPPSWATDLDLDEIPSVRALRDDTIFSSE